MERYNLRNATKRRRLTNRSVGSSYGTSSPFKRKTPILFMPTEVLEKIFSFLAYDELAKSVRLVNKRFRVIIQHYLNVSFRTIEKKLAHNRKKILYYINFKTNDTELKYLCHMLNINENILFQHKLIVSAIWRYLHNRYNHTNICMYAGAVLDIFEDALSIIDINKFMRCDIWEETPDLNVDMHALCGTVKTFILYFDRVTEMPLNDSAFSSGCKMLDILDCSIHNDREILEESYENNQLHLKIKYHFEHSWLIAINLTDGKSKPWSEEQRLMYMRLRRIVMSFTEMKSEYQHYKRERRYRMKHHLHHKKPVNSVYTGFGEVGNKFFYYGVMNRGAYGVKFENVRSLYQIVEDEERGDEPNVERENQIAYPIPFLGLDICIEVDCPLYLGPKKILEALIEDEEKREMMIFSKKKQDQPETFDMKLKFFCKSARYPRLPEFYETQMKCFRC